MTKKIALIVLNVCFIGIFILALLTFTKQKSTFDDEKIVSQSVFKAKTFAAAPFEIDVDGGIKAWMMEEKSVPLVALDFYFDKAGYAFDDENKKGLAVFAASVLIKRAGDMDDETFQNLLEENAIDLKVNALEDIFEISLTAPKQNLETAANLLKAVLTMPNTNGNDVLVAKNKQLTAIDMQSENPEIVLGNQFKKKLFGTHPKARVSIGNKESVASFEPADISAFVKKHFKKNNLKIALAGDISKEQGTVFLRNLFAELPTGDEEKDLPPVLPNYDGSEENIERDIPQVISFFAALGTPRLSNDFYPLYIANEIFGGSGLSSRLNVRAREKEGLTYGAYTYLDSDEDAPRLVGTFASAKENYEKMRFILLDEWQKMATEGVTKEEVNTIKNSMLSAFNLRFASLSSVAKQLLYMQKENLGIDFFQKRNEYVAKVTFEAVNAAAKKYFANKPLILTIGNNE